MRSLFRKGTVKNRAGAEGAKQESFSQNAKLRSSFYISSLFPHVIRSFERVFMEILFNFFSQTLILYKQNLKMLIAKLNNQEEPDRSYKLRTLLQIFAPLRLRVK